jgi:galactokinase
MHAACIWKAAQVATGTVRTHSPGRVNLIGDHTDYNHGLAMPMAVDLGTTVSFTPDDTQRVVLHSAQLPGAADVALDVPLDPATLSQLEPPWSRYVAAVVAVVRPPHGGAGTVESTVPLGAGLSSSAALEVSLALAFGLRADPVAMARTCQRAEHAATGVASGLMDQLTVSGARPGCALVIDFSDLSVHAVPVPVGADLVVVHSGESRTLAATGYAARRAECEEAARRLGPLGLVDAATAAGVPDPVLRKRARHVATECARVRHFAEALTSGDLVEAGRLMTASHRSLADDFEVSTPALDDLVAWLEAHPGVHGARLTGAGFGGCVVALTEPGALDIEGLGRPAWRVKPAPPARVLAPG